MTNPLRAPLTIERKDPAADPGSYESLREAGIERAQALSGEEWTDFNVHDPGVTLLEQLCFQLSELIYRNDFPVQDFLCGDDGKLDLDLQGLAAPARIFPARPATAADLRKVIVGRVAGIDNAWVETSAHGLATVSVAIRPDAERQPDRILDQVRQTCYRNRNLCEDVEHDIRIVRRRACVLHAVIEVSAEDHLTRILGESYFLASRYIAGGLRHTTFKKALESGRSLEEIFTGPLLKHGMIDAETLEETENPVQIAELISLIAAVDGVERVDELWLEAEGKPYRQSIPRVDRQGYLSLVLPDTAISAPGVLPRANGRSLAVSPAAVARYLEQLLYSDETGQRSLESAASLLSVPVARRRRFDQYTSIQDMLPPLYGVNRFGQVLTDRPEQQARLRQLKAFLLIFDQLMADFAAGLDNIRAYFSTDESLDASYCCQPIGNDLVADAEALYVEPQSEFLPRLTRVNDNFPERRNRVLDYLLALYGESFPDTALTSTAAWDSDEDIARRLLRRKLDFLKNIAWLTRNRGGGFDYSRPCWGTLNLSGLHARLSLLLDIGQPRERSLARPLIELGLRPVPREDDLESYELQPVAPDIVIDDVFARVPGTLNGGSASIEALHDKAKREVLSKSRRLSEALLRGGTRLDNYRVGRLADFEGCVLIFRPGKGGWWVLANLGEERECIELAHGLRSLLVSVNRRCEGLHVLEHLLLRRTHDDGSAGGESPNEDDEFLHGRLTVVFPDWTVRCHDAAFRLLAEELVRANCPAHLMPGILWLGFDDMYRFESLYSFWLKKKRRHPEGSAEIDDIAAELALFVVTRRTQESVAPRRRPYV